MVQKLWPKVKFFQQSHRQSNRQSNRQRHRVKTDRRQDKTRCPRIPFRGHKTKTGKLFECWRFSIYNEACMAVLNLEHEDRIPASLQHCTDYCKTLIFRWLYFRETTTQHIFRRLNFRICHICSIIPLTLIIGEDIISRLQALANLHQNKVLANKKYFTVFISLSKTVQIESNKIFMFFRNSHDWCLPTQRIPSTCMTMSRTCGESFCVLSRRTSCWKASACASLFWFSMFSRPSAIAIMQPEHKHNKKYMYYYGSLCLPDPVLLPSCNLNTTINIYDPSPNQSLQVKAWQWH